MSNGIRVHTSSIHHIDIQKETNEEVNIDGDTNDFGIYLNSLVEEVIDNSNNTRNFKFRSDSTEVRNQIEQLLEDSSQREPLQIISDRLLDIEIDAQDEYGQITDIQRGSLLQALIEFSDNKYFILTKVDHDTFLDEADLTKRIGLPFESYVLKACIIEIENEAIDNISVFDTQSRISKYWWQRFLELAEITTNERNTKKAFSSISTHLTRRLKRVYPSDFTFIWNNLASYFETHNDFNYDEMIDYIIGDYQPRNEDLDIDDLKNSLNSLPERDNFDKSFQIIQDVIENKFSRTINLDDQIELKIKEHVEDLEHKIEAFESDEGRKYLKIETEKGFNYFKSYQSSNEDS